MPLDLGRRLLCMFGRYLDQVERRPAIVQSVEVVRLVNPSVNARADKLIDQKTGLGQICDAGHVGPCDRFLLLDGAATIWTAEARMVQPRRIVRCRTIWTNH